MATRKCLVYRQDDEHADRNCGHRRIDRGVPADESGDRTAHHSGPQPDEGLHVTDMEARETKPGWKGRERRPQGYIFNL